MSAISTFMLSRFLGQHRTSLGGRVLAAAAMALIFLAVIPRAAGAQSCGQPSHTWLAIGFSGASLVENGGTRTTNRSVNLYPTGIVKPNTNMTFTFYDAGNLKLIRKQATAAAGGNCVVPHQGDEFSASQLGVRSLIVYATYTRWEDNTKVTRQLGTLVVNDGPNGSDFYPGPCSQPSKVFVAFVGQSGSLSEGGGRRTVSTATTLAMTGIINRNRTATFEFVSRQTGATVLTHITHGPDNNCVIRHEDEQVSASVLGVGLFDVQAKYERHETGQTVTVNLGVLEVQ